MKKLISIGLVSIFAFSMMASVAFAQVDFSTDLAGTFGLGTQELKGTLIKVVNILLGFLGVLAIIVILVGGFKWMTSGGNEERVAGARQMLIAGIIGLAIILGSFAIVQFVVSGLGA